MKKKIISFYFVVSLAMTVICGVAMSFFATGNFLNWSFGNKSLFSGVFELLSGSEQVNYIYFDLAAGNVNITDDTYSGYIYDSAGTIRQVSGTHTEENKYYVFQSNNDSQHTGTIPEVAGINGWGSFITNNSDVSAVVEKWKTDAANAGRTSTNNIIKVETASAVDLTVDDIWSARYRQNPTALYHMRDVGLWFAPNSSSAHLTLTFVGDNRFEGIQYGVADNSTINAAMTIKGASDTDTLTVASTDGISNYFGSAIGGDDVLEDVYNLTLSGGVIYAGTRSDENCTAIGAGGNGYGQVNITGGTVTAVASTSGTAVGGGIGYSDPGGDADVTINSGKVYAYNHGIRVEVKDEDSTVHNYVIPSSAIGGGSSAVSDGNAHTTVNISGGDVFAQSVHGVAIGGGGSALQKGGDATINISGGNIVATSIKGTFEDESVAAGVSIGGGTGYTSGGNATVNITGEPTLDTGSIGGGKATDGNGQIGSANVTIEGGTIQGQVIMAKGAATDCSFLMTGGTIDNNAHKKDEPTAEFTKNGVTFTFIEGNGGAAFVQNGTATMKGGTIKNCNDFSRHSVVGDGGGAIYVDGGSFIMNGGTIENCSGLNGGAALVKGGTITIKGENENVPVIQNCSAVDGGGVMSWGSSSDITIENARLIGNHATVDGGGVYAYAGSSITIGTGTVIDNNKSDKNGGGAFVAAGSFTMNGGTISNNTAHKQGGGVCVAAGSFTMNNGTISKNSTDENGGGAYVGSGQLTMENGLIAENTAKYNGGGVCVVGGSFTMNGGIIENCSGLNGGAALVKGGTITIKGENENVPVIQNCSGVDGGGVMSWGAESDITIENAEVIGNYASANGGGVYAYDGSSITIGTGTVIENNRADKEGGGVRVSDGSFIMKDGSVSKNTAGENGGGIFVNGTVLVNHGILSLNKAINGGAAYVYGGNFTMESGTMTNNEAYEKNSGAAEDGNQGYGGGVYVGGGDIFIGIENCTKATPCELHQDGKSTYHPIVRENKAVFGGGLAVNNGTVNLYCCSVLVNESDNAGTGMNIFVYGENGTLNHYKDGAEIGEDKDHGIVTVGGTTNVIGGSQTEEISIIYHSNSTQYDPSASEAIWNGSAPSGYYLNLPYCPSSWETAAANKNYTFVGWTKSLKDTAVATAVRKKGDYLSVGTPVEIKDSTTDGQKEIHFYAVWAPEVNSISYAYSLDGVTITNGNLSGGTFPTTYNFQMASYNADLPTPTHPGYTFKKWMVYAHTDKVSNWDADPTVDTVTRLDQLKNHNPWTGKFEQNFGDITLVAVFEAGYNTAGLKIEAAFDSAVDENQTTIFHITGTPDRAGAEEIDMRIAVKEAGFRTVVGLPFGTYTITEDTNWSWRYDVQSIENITDNTATYGSASATVQVKEIDKQYVIRFNNTEVENKWVDGNSYNQNIFNQQ